MRILAFVCAIMLAEFSGQIARAERTTMTTQTLTQSIYDVPVKTMQAQGGKTETLAQYKGDVLLIVNTATYCGNTPQYKALEELYEKDKASGLRVLGFPCNDFAGQEPGTEAEITQFCNTKYHVTFPLYAKIHTKGPEKAPLYHYLTEGEHAPFKGDVTWNFEKFLVGRDGRIVARFAPKTKPDSPEVTAALEKALAAGKP